MPWQAINPRSPKLQIAGDVTHFAWVRVATVPVPAKLWGGGWVGLGGSVGVGGVGFFGGWVGVLFVCFKAGYFFNEVMPWQI